MATEVVKIVDTGGNGDYSSLSAWEAGEQRDLVAADEIAVADCRCSTGAADTDSVTINGWTTDGTRYIKIWTDPDQGYRHDGKWNTEKYRLEVVDHDALLVYEDCVQIIGLQIFADDPDGGRKNVYLLSANASNKSVVAYNILKGNGSASSAVIRVSDADSIVDIYNNAGYGSKKGIEIADADTINIYNNTFYGANISRSVGILVSAGTVIVKNCAVFNTSDDFSGTMTIDYCASDDGDGTNAVIPSNWDDVFVDIANHDFHLKSTDTDLRDAGIDLSSDPNLSFTDDIDGETRSAPWDIGADEYVAAGGSLIRIINEALNFNESFSKLSSTNKIVNETLQLDETYPKLQATNKIINETLQIDESNEKKGAVSKIIDESLQISEALVKKGHTKKIINEQVQISEVLSKRGSTKKVVNESLELNENISRVSGIIKVINETLQISELVAKIPGITKVVNETLQFSESVFRKTGITKVVNEALQIAENIVKTSWITKVVNEILNLSESAFKRGVIKKVVSETLQLSENVIRRSGLVRIINETLRISENIIRSLAVALGWREVLEAYSLITLEESKKTALTLEKAEDSTITTEISGNSPLD